MLKYPVSKKLEKKLIYSIIIGLVSTIIILILVIRPGILIIPRNPIQPSGLIVIYRDRTKDEPVFTIPEFCETAPDGTIILYNHLKEYDAIHDRIVLKIKHIKLFFQKYWNCIYPDD